MVEETLCELKVTMDTGRTIHFVTAAQLEDLRSRGVVLREYKVPLGNQRQHEALVTLMQGADPKVASYFTSLLAMVHNWGCQPPQTPGAPPAATE